MRFRSKKFQAFSDSKTKNLQRARFRMNFFTTRQILKQNFYNASDFDLKILRSGKVWRKQKIF